MKITDIRPIIVADQRNFLFVVVETDEGIQGIGEAGITWREQAVAGFIEALRPTLIGQDPRRIEHLWQVMFRCGFFPAGRIGAAAISGIDIALWDILSKSLNVPLYQLLGGQVRDRVVCYPHIKSDSTAGLVDAANEKVAAGWQFVRFDLPAQGDTLDPERSVQMGIEQFAAVREAVGPNVQMLMDVHTRLNPAQAIQLCQGLEPYRPYFLEDPIRSENSTSLEKVARSTTIPIAMGEQYATKWEFQHVVEQELIDYCRVDLCIVGGMTEALKIRGWCELHYIDLAPHNPLGPVSTAACLHLDLATSNFAVQECARVPGTVFPDLFPVQVPFDKGWLLPPTLPGLGIEVDLSAVDAHPAIEGDCPRLARPDGSFTNW